MTVKESAELIETTLPNIPMWKKIELVSGKEYSEEESREALKEVQSRIYF